MNLLLLSTLPFSAAHTWSKLSPRRPALSRVLAFTVLPLALLPPVMLYLAGSLHSTMFPPELARSSWASIAAVFFLAEILTLLALGWLIKQVARSNGLPLDDHAAFLIAALAPIPLWLSSLGLLVPNLLFTVTLAAFALALSCRAVYHGIVELGGAREPVTAAWITQIAVGGALIPWVLLVAVLMTA